jgi:hypothetical protein
MILARILEDDGTPALELTVDAAYRYTGDWWEIGGVSFVVKGRIDGAASEPFERATRDALRRCGDSLGLPAGDSVEPRTALL